MQIPKPLRGAAVATAMLSALTLTACDNPLTSKDDSLSKLLPESSFIFAQFDLTPSKDQIQKMGELAQRMPEKARAENFEKLRSDVLNDMFKDEEIDFDKDVKPWLEDEVAAAAFDVDGSDNQTGIVAVMLAPTKDKKAAQQTLENKYAKTGRAFDFIDDTAILAVGDESDSSAASAAIAQIKDVKKGSVKSLSGKANYKSVESKMKDDSPMKYWVDPTNDAIYIENAGLEKEADTIISELGSQAKADEKTREEAKKALAEYGSMFGEAYASADGLVMNVKTEKAPESYKQIGTLDAKPFSKVNASAAMAIETKIAENTAGQLTDEMKKQLGDDGVAFVEKLGTNAKLMIEKGSDPKVPNIGGSVEMKTDSDASFYVTKINEYVTKQGLTYKDFDKYGVKGNVVVMETGEKPIQLIYGTKGKDFVFSINEDYVKNLAEKPEQSLADSDVFKRAVPNVNKAMSAVFIAPMLLEEATKSVSEASSNASNASQPAYSSPYSGDYGSMMNEQMYGNGIAANPAALSFIPGPATTIGSVINVAETGQANDTATSEEWLKAIEAIGVITSSDDDGVAIEYRVNLKK